MASDRVCLVRTKFEDLRTGNATFGWRLYDNYANTYNNFFTQEDIPDDDIELLEMAVRDAVTNENVRQFFNWIIEEKDSIDIDDETYTFDQIKETLKPLMG